MAHNDAIAPSKTLAEDLAALSGILDEAHIPEKDIDAGVPRIACAPQGCAAETAANTAGNGIREPGEVYGAIISLLEREEDAFVESGGKASRPFTDLVSMQSTFRVPWLMNDFSPTTTRDDRLLLTLAGGIDRIKGAIGASGPPAGTKAFNTALVRELTRWMLSPNGLRAAPIGLDEIEEPLVDFLSRRDPSRRGDCTELSRLAYEVFRLAGLRTTFFDVQQDAFDPTITQHMAVGVALDPAYPGRFTTIDLVHHGWISEEGHPLQSTMPAISALAVYEGSRALHAMDGATDIDTSLTANVDALFQRALSYDPFYPLTHYNYAFFLSQWKGNRTGAIEEARRAEGLRPFERDFKALVRRLSPSAILPSPR